MFQQAAPSPIPFEAARMKSGPCGLAAELAHRFRQRIDLVEEKSRQAAKRSILCMA
jgi:hypothetical protein